VVPGSSRIQGHRHSKYLLSTALAHCEEQQFRNVYLLTTDVQKKTIAMYKKAGFEPTASIELQQWGQNIA